MTCLWNERYNIIKVITFPWPIYRFNTGFPGGSDGKGSAWNAGDLGSIPESGRSAGGGHGNPLQYSCLENPMDGGAWWATSMGSQTIRHDWATKHKHNTDLTQSLTHLTAEADHKICENVKGPKNKNNLEKNEWVRRVIIPNFKTYTKPQ